MVMHRPIVWAHRGSRRKSPENTLEAFLRAEWEGADGVELDVRLSRDGVPVVMHDASLKRTTGVDALVKELSFREIKDIYPGVPSLEEVLKIHSGRVRLNVELKTHPQDSLPLVRALADAVACLFLGYGNADACMASAFDPRALDEIRHAAPRFRVGWLMKPPSFPGHGFSGRPRSFEAIHPHYFMVSPGFFAKARAEGKLVNVWTVNGPTQAARLSSWGADGLITDCPAALLKRIEPLAPEALVDPVEAVGAA
jgi:glycerophosphoryl diester phosphodiesterase